MSNVIMCSVGCDGENCGKTFGNEPTMIAIRARAKKMGWIRVFNMDYCPTCKKKLLLKE